jgi:LuxR family transcriptional regulator, maltose regulon positive regulatory protein
MTAHPRRDRGPGFLTRWLSSLRRRAGGGTAARLPLEEGERTPRERALRLVPSQAELRAPVLRRELVERTDLTDRLLEAHDAAVVVVVAPVGYGKTTLVAQWAEADPRPFGWLSASPRTDDPVILLRYLALVLDSLEPLDAATFAELFAGADLMSVLLPRLNRALSATSRPFVLVLDGVDSLQGSESAAVLEALADHVPPGSQLVLTSRGEPPIPLAQLRASGRMLSIGPESLAMSEAEAATLLQAVGVDLDPHALATLVQRAEGWPAALYLAALALRDAYDREEAAELFTGDDRLVADYLRNEALTAISDRSRDFLFRTSVLDQLSGPLCDAVAERSDSANVLDDLAESNLFVVPLDRRREWYRYHHLFSDMLRAELRRREPALEPVLHQRASAWLEDQGDTDGAIDHARAAGDLERVAALVWSSAPALLTTGREATVARWLDGSTLDEIAEYPPLALTKAWWCLTAGDTAAVEHWTTVASNGDPADPLPGGTSLRAAVALLGALTGKDGLTRMRDDAAVAFELDRAGSPYRPIARFLEGSAARLLGDRELARARLEEGARLGGALSPAVYTHCLHQLALLAVDDGEWSEAGALLDRALQVLDQYFLSERPAMAGLYGTASLAHARAGAMVEARAESKHGLWLLEMLVGVAPWIVVETGLVLARTNLLLGDIGTARTLVQQTERVLHSYPDAGALPEQLRELERMLDAEAVPVGLEATPLTPAEMRVLRYLPTHLSFEAIADELFVSRNTVKTQAIAVYRKLGVTSRARAVEEARGLGLIEQ